jgi:hypothetical protein
MASAALSTMWVTNERLIFLPPIRQPFSVMVAALYYIPLVNFLAMLLIYQLPPRASMEAFELSDVERFWTWRPEFSGPPMLQIGTSGWSFRLLQKQGRQFAPIESVREHFEVVEAAWKAARARAGQSV